MTGGYSAISSYSRVEIMHLIQGRPQRAISELVDATGLHPNTVREHVQRLIDAGYVIAETERRTTRGRPRVLYTAATGVDAASSPVAQRKAQDAARRGDLMRRVYADDVADTDLGADAVHQLDALVDDLGGAGFDPVIDEDSLTVDLTPCPHAPAAERRGTLCNVHIGLMEGVLAQAGGPLHVEGIAPSCDPTHCVVQLTTIPG
ncbi:helix-turn-helix transcriptional regulator [Microbacterium allomyrinae]|uniref:ArsR family transcriptional regulator n=1 Tax=Microbacterium allomyrinae TaxID=2830666 RepID=A0A9X1LSX3_9MICO|nr:ArsR family transcriptional regulator [Microbacterium allomyrinae]MCC2031143.1 ArsR family transcriptional regulator [Microbacterium allomyrinae]